MNNYNTDIFRENPEEFEDNVNKIVEQKLQEAEQRKEDAEKALNEARERRSQVLELTGNIFDWFKVQDLVQLRISGTRRHCEAGHASREKC